MDLEFLYCITFDEETPAWVTATLENFSNGFDNLPIRGY